MNIPEGYFFTKDHEFCKVEDDTAIIGLSDYAQQQLGDITYVEMPEVGDTFDKGDSFGTVEAVKAASDVFMPISGEVIEINEDLEDSPEMMNEDCYEKGWIIKIKIADKAELEDLMNTEAYKATIEK